MSHATVNIEAYLNVKDEENPLPMRNNLKSRGPESKILVDPQTFLGMIM